MLTLKLTGIFLGVLARAFFPWLRKLRQGKVTHFHKRYLISAIGSVLIGSIITLLIFPKFEVSSTVQVPNRLNEPAKSKNINNEPQTTNYESFPTKLEVKETHNV